MSSFKFNASSFAKASEDPKAWAKAMSSWGQFDSEKSATDFYLAEAKGRKSDLANLATNRTLSGLKFNKAQVALLLKLTDAESLKVRLRKDGDTFLLQVPTGRASGPKSTWVYSLDGKPLGKPSALKASLKDDKEASAWWTDFDSYNKSSKKGAHGRLDFWQARSGASGKDGRNLAKAPFADRVTRTQKA